MHDIEITDPLESYARTRDAGYPPATQYVDVMGALDEPLRSTVLTLYAVLHRADDLADDASRPHADRRHALGAYVHEFLRVVRDDQWPNDPSTADLFTGCREILRARAVTSTSSFEAVFAMLHEMTLWPPEPHFAARLEVEAFNYRKFAAIVDVFAPHLLAEARPELRPLLRAMFIEHMLAMHVVNVLMDLGEDRAAGQLWFARGDYDAAMEPTPQARMALLRRGHAHMRHALPLCDRLVVGEQSARFFMGLRGIFEALASDLDGRPRAPSHAPECPT